MDTKKKAEKNLLEIVREKNEGVTLVVLAVSVVIILVISGITINAIAGDNGLENQAKSIKDNSIMKQKTEENSIESLYSDLSTESNIQPIVKKEVVRPNVIYSFTEQKSLVDEYGNKIVIPEGFKVLNDETTNAIHVSEGIVIIDTFGNEFVWVPVGDVYTDTKHGDHKTIKLGRYSFDSNGNPSPYTNTSYLEQDAKDTLMLIDYRNMISNDINGFIKSAKNNHGYYIGRYEARTSILRVSKYQVLTPITENRNLSVYNCITQLEAGTLCKTMYLGKTFCCDLVNSYAWDTALVFAETFGTDKNYANSSRKTLIYAITGTNNTSTKDSICNIYDMAGNCWEWTTESFNLIDTCSCRGGLFLNGFDKASTRNERLISISDKNYSCRPVIYN